MLGALVVQVFPPLLSLMYPYLWYVEMFCRTFWRPHANTFYVFSSLLIIAEFCCVICLHNICFRCVGLLSHGRITARILCCLYMFKFIMNVIQTGVKVFCCLYYWLAETATKPISMANYYLKISSWSSHRQTSRWHKRLFFLRKGPRMTELCVHFRSSSSADS